jgi:UDP-glucose 4-epimerase
MRAVVTGGAGFIGSHLCEVLLKEGHTVFALDDLSTGSPVNLLPLLDHPAFRFVRGSVLDQQLVDALVAEGDRVFHLAAAVGVHTIVDQPLRSLRTNLEGTQVVLDAVLRHDRRILITSTSEVYGKNGADKLREDADRILGSPLKSRWSYASAKAIDELIAQIYWQTHGLRVVVARLFNTVGPRQTGRYGMVVPRLVGQALESEPLTVYGDGTQTRCFCHVHDIVPALVQLLETPVAYGQAVNLGNPTETSIIDLAHMILRITGADADIQFVSYEAAYGSGYEDMRRRIPDIGKAAELIGFCPQRHLDVVVNDVAEDLRMRSTLENMRWDARRAQQTTSPLLGVTGPHVGNGHRPSHARAILTKGVAW